MSSRVLPKDFQTVPPELFNNFQGHGDGLLTDAKEIRFDPLNGKGQTFRELDTVCFQMSSNRVIDPSTIRLHYTMKVKGTTSDQPAATNIQYGVPSFSFIGRDIDNHEYSEPYATAAANAVWDVTWPCEHASSVIQSIKLGFNGDDEIDHIENYNRVRGMLASLTIDEHSKRTWGQIEGYYSQTTGKDTLSYGGTSDAMRPMYIPPDINNRVTSAQDPARTTATDGVYMSKNGLNRAHYSQEFLQTRRNRISAWELATKTCETVKYKALKENTGDKKVSTDGTEITYTKTADTEYAEWQTPLDLVTLFNQHRYIDMSKFGFMQLDILLDQKDVVLNRARKATQWFTGESQASVTVPDYELVGVYITCMSYRPSATYKAALDMTFSGGMGMVYNTEQYRVFTPNFSSLTPQIRIQKNVQSLKSVYVFFSDYQHVSGKNDASKGLVNATNTFPNYGLQRYNFWIDNVQVTSHAIDCRRNREGRAIYELAKSLRLHGEGLLGTDSVSIERFHSDRCVIGLDLETSGLKSGRPVKEIVLDLEFEAPLDSATAYNNEERERFLRSLTAYVVLHYDSTILVRPGNSVIQIE